MSYGTSLFLFYFLMEREVDRKTTDVKTEKRPRGFDYVL